MIIVQVQAKGTAGHILYRNLIKHKWIFSWFSHIFSFYFTIPDIMQKTLDCLYKCDPNLKWQLLKNTTRWASSFNLLLTGQGIKMVMSQHLVRGWFPVIYRYGSDYDVLITIDETVTSPEVIVAINEVISDYTHQFYN